MLGHNCFQTVTLLSRSVVTVLLPSNHAASDIFPASPQDKPGIVEIPGFFFNDRRNYASIFADATG